MKRTQWFPVSIPPTRHGRFEYRGDSIDDPLFLHWNGFDFGYWVDPVRRINWTIYAPMDGDQWRGLTQEGR